MKENYKKGQTGLAKGFWVHRFMCLLAVLLISLIFDGNVQAQTVTVKGTVKSSSTGETLPGVNVAVKGGALGTVTNADGEFSISAPSKSTLVFSYLGFKKYEFRVVSGLKSVVIKLEEDAKQIDDVVVIGYQQMSRRKVAAAVSSISGKDLKNIPAPSIDIMMQGKISGVDIQNFSGEPGSKQSFVVRGNTAISRGNDFYSTSDPLFVIDGVITDVRSMGGFSTSNTNFLAGLNPSDIESIDVLKDASAAAIYGSRAGNGVVIIKTKSGVAGKQRLTFSSYVGVTTSPTLPGVYAGATERRMKMQNLYDTGNYFQLRKNPIMLTDSLNPAFNNHTDWFGLFYKPGIVQNYDVALTGGTDKSNYRLSANYYDEHGALRGTGFQRYTFNNKLFNKLWDRVEMTTTMTYSLINRNPAPGGDSRSVLSISADNFPSSLLYLSPEDKKMYLGQYDQNRDENTEGRLVLSNLSVVKLLKSLSFRSNITIERADNRRDVFSPSTSNTSGIASASSDVGKDTRFMSENYLNFDQKFAKSHEIFLTVGQSVEREKQYRTTVGGSYIPTDQIKVVSGVSNDNLYGSSGYNAATMLSYFSQLSYYYKERYNLSLAWRADGSSRFGPDKRWGYFPSASAFWILSDEPFMKKYENWLGLWKFRASYGITGQQPSDYYGQYDKYQVKGAFPGAYSSSTTTYNGTTAIGPNWSGVAQDKLTWEESRQWDFGTDVELFKNRLNFQIDAYNKENRGIRFDFPMPVTSGYDTYYTNAASIRNAGLEFMVNGRIFRPENKFQWNVYLTASYNRNTIIKLPENNKPIINGDWVLITGQPLNEYYMYNYQGIYKTNAEVPVNPLTGKVYANMWGNPFKAGDAKYQDVDGDYIFNQWGLQDRMPMGDPNPRWTGGFTNEFYYKNWSLNVQCTYVLGRDIYNESLGKMLEKYNNPGGANEEGVGYSRDYATSGDFWNQYDNGTFNGPEDYFARRALLDMSYMTFWKANDPNRDNAKFPNASPYAMQYNYTPFSSMYKENGSYLKINRIILGYLFDKGWVKTLGIDRLRFYGVIENVGIIKSKNTTIPDPESVDTRGFYTGTMYALPKKFTFGVEVTF
ncbi:MAG: SusC/RagA family TonB-linked outer membrane protein [Bacteroidota bacterium]|nr:SusC/RagA family TonB-linked outer membrane protein [Bacteroidota bacterium]MDP4204464.1 SusC/RagA family TonB-linked outer membrane protein [Bacteroidota bacterium]